jgi:hypothetical protein
MTRLSCAFALRSIAVVSLVGSSCTDKRGKLHGYVLPARRERRGVQRAAPGVRLQR